MKKFKFDFIVILIVIVIAASFYFIPKISNDSLGDVVVIQDKQIIGSYSLKEDRTVPIKGLNDGYNLLMIQNGTARICDANCPDMLCVKQKHISRNHESIICLPHKLVIQISSGKESGIDAVTN